MHDGAPDLDVGRWRDRVEIGHRHRDVDPLTAALERELDLAADGIVERTLELDERRRELALDLEQDVAGLERPVARTLGNEVVDDQEPLFVGARLPDGGFGLRAEVETRQLVERLRHKDGLERAARDGCAAPNQLESSDDAVEREEEARGGLSTAAGIEGDDAAVDVEHGGPRGPT